MNLHQSSALYDLHISKLNLLLRHSLKYRPMNDKYKEFDMNLLGNIYYRFNIASLIMK